MNWRLWLLATCIVVSVPLSQGRADTKITWKKVVVDTNFRSEGVAVADVNKDGKKDILVGNVWFEAPTWKVHQIRPGKDDYREGDKNVYSQSFCVWAEDINKDGWVDQLVVPFPGKEMFWYENPQNRPGPWKEHMIWHSACNETPQYVDLFGTGKRVLIMGWQPKGQDNLGQMAWFAPGKDPTKPWTMNPISKESVPALVASDRKIPAQIVPGTFKYAHGLGVGDVNGDGRRDVLCTGGWWEQPARVTDQPWQFHKADLGPNCADMHTLDMDGDGKNDIVSSAAHDVGFWWHQQQGNGFVRRDLFPTPAALAAAPAQGQKLAPEDEQLFKAVNNYRVKQLLISPLPYSAALSRAALAYVQSQDKVPLPDFLAKEKFLVNPSARVATNLLVLTGSTTDELVKSLAEEQKGLPPYATHMGVARFTGSDGRPRAVVMFADSGKFLLPGQTHALIHVDIDGDGVKDFVTGRRWWAHGPKGDYAPNDPAFVYWFKGKKGQGGEVSFTPHLIDDDSGIGTQFTVEDIDGDGIPDIIVSNKKGTHILIQVRSAEVQPRNKD